MPRKKQAYPRPRGRPSLADFIILVGAMDGPVSFANTPKEWPLETLLLDEPEYIIRRRAFYRAIHKLTNLGLIRQTDPGSYPASWSVGNSRAERKAAQDYLWKRELEIIPPYMSGKKETKKDIRKNVKVKKRAWEILRDEAKRRGIPYEPKPMSLDDSKQIVEDVREKNKLLRVIYDQRGRLRGSAKLARPSP
jgi:hypothetical protein